MRTFRVSLLRNMPGNRSPNRLKTFFPPDGLETAKRTLLWKIWTHISSVQAGTPDWGNIESLSKVRFEYHTQGVVWHDGY